MLRISPRSSAKPENPDWLWEMIISFNQFDTHIVIYNVAGQPIFLKFNIIRFRYRTVNIPMTVNTIYRLIRGLMP